MPKIPKLFTVEKRKNYTVSRSAGLPYQICAEWYRKRDYRDDGSIL